MSGSEIHTLEMQLQRQKLDFDKEKAIYEQRISQLQQKLEDALIDNKSYQKSQTMLIKTINDICNNRDGKFYESLNNEINEVQSVTEQNTKKMMEALNQVLTYVQTNFKVFEGITNNTFLLSDNNSRIGTKTVDDRLTIYKDSNKKNLDYLVDKNRKLKTKLGNLRKLLFCENCKKLMNDELTRKIDSESEKKENKRAQSVNINRYANNNSFITEMEKNHSIETNSERKTKFINKNLFLEFNKCESMKSNKQAHEIDYVDDKPLSVNFKLNSLSKFEQRESKDNWNITSNHCSNDTGKQGSPEMKFFIPKTQFTFNNSNGSSNMVNLRSINSEGFEISEEISDFNTVTNENEVTDSRFSVKPSKFKNIKNEIIRSEISNDLPAETKELRSEEESNVIHTDKDQKIFSLDERKKSSQENISTPQFSLQKETKNDVAKYYEIYSQHTSKERLSTNKKFKEDDKGILEDRRPLENIKEVDQLNSAQKKIVFVKNKSSKEEIEEKNKEVLSGNRNESAFYTLKKKNKNQTASKNTMIEEKKDNYSESQDIIIGDSYTVSDNNRVSIERIDSKEQECDKVKENDEKNHVPKGDTLKEIEDNVICSLDNENIEKIIEYYRRDLTVTEESKSTLQLKSRVSGNRIISFSNIDKSEEPETEEKRKISDEIREEIKIELIGNIRKSGNKNNGLAIQTKDSFVESRIKEMLLSKTNPSDSKKKIKRNLLGDFNSKSESFEHIKEVSDEDSKYSKNVKTSREAIQSKKSSFKSQTIESTQKLVKPVNEVEKAENKLVSEYKIPNSKSSQNFKIMSNMKREQHHFMQSLNIPQNNQWSILENKKMNKNNSYQNFHIFTQSKKEFALKQLELRHDLSHRTENNCENSINGISPILKQKRFGFDKKSEVYESNNENKLQDQTLKDVVNKINMIKSEVNEIKESMKMPLLKPEMNLNVLKKEENEQDKTCNEKLASLFNDESKVEPLKDSSKIDYYYSTDMRDKKDGEYVCLDLEDTESDDDTSYYQHNKNSLNSIEEGDLRLESMKKSTKKLIPMREQKPYNKIDRARFERNMKKEYKVLNSKVKEIKPKKPTIPFNVKEYCKIEGHCCKLDKKVNKPEKTRNNYYKLYMEKKNKRSENSMICNRNDKKTHKKRRKEDASYPYIIDKQILKIKKSDVVIERQSSNKKRNRDRSGQKFISGQKNKYSGYNRDIGYEDLSNKKIALKSYIEKLEKSFEI